MKMGSLVMLRTNLIYLMISQILVISFDPIIRTPYFADNPGWAPSSPLMVVAH